MNVQYMRQIERLYLQMYDLLFCYARSALDNDSLAEEAVQETFQIACQRPEILLHSPSPEGWLVNTLKNVIRNNRRKQESTRQLLLAYLSGQIKELSIDGEILRFDLLYGNIAGTEEYELLREMVIEKRSYLEMASKRGISLSACRKRVQRAKETLRKKIEL